MTLKTLHKTGEPLFLLPPPTKQDTLAPTASPAVRSRFDAHKTRREVLPMAAVTAEQVREVLMTVNDPELGFDIVNLGLIYDIQVDGDQVYVLMTLTTPACAAGPFIVEQVKQKIQELEGVGDVQVSLTFEPRWTEAMMSDELKKMREWGIYG